MKDPKEKVLFVCTAGMQRSPTAARLVNERAGKRYEAAFAGIATPMTESHLIRESLDWADHIFVMEPMHKKWIEEHLDTDKQIHVLSIPDTYSVDDPVLRTVLEERLSSYLTL